MTLKEEKKKKKEERNLSNPVLPGKITLQQFSNSVVKSVQEVLDSHISRKS
jgi:hypothetical protein